MISKAIKQMFSTVPNVWVNKYTKVICQGITGNQVLVVLVREPSRLSKLWITELRWSEESTPRRQEPLISVCPFSRTVLRPKRELDAMLQWSTCLLLALPTPLSKPSKPSSTSSWSSLTVIRLLFRYSPARYDQGEARTSFPDQDQSDWS